MTTLAQTVKARRKDTGLSQGALAALAGVRQGTISRIESGEIADLSGESLSGLAAAFECSIDELLGRAPTGGMQIIGGDTLPIAAISPSPLNPRKSFDQTRLEELARSIEQQGLIEPLIVRPDPENNERYEIIAGERRWRAAEIAGLTEVPVKIREATDDEIVALALVENMQRADLSPLEEADAFARLAELNHKKWKPSVIGEKIGKTKEYVQQRLNLRDKLSEPAKDALETGEITFSQARELTRAPEDRQAEALKQIAAGTISRAPDIAKTLRRDTVPAVWAIFDLADYSGGIYTDDKGHKHLTDLDQFKRLQRQAGALEAERLDRKWKWAEFREGYFYRDHWPDQCLSPITAGAIVHMDFEGRVKTHTGLLRPEDREPEPEDTARAERDSQEAEQRQAEVDAQDQALETLVGQIAEQLVNDVTAAKRLFLFDAIRGYDLDGAEDLFAILPGTADLENEDLAAHIFALEGKNLDAAFCALAIYFLNTYGFISGVPPLHAALAQHFGIEIPDILAPPAKE